MRRCLMSLSNDGDNYISIRDFDSGPFAFLITVPSANHWSYISSNSWPLKGIPKTVTTHTRYALIIHGIVFETWKRKRLIVGI